MFISYVIVRERECHQPTSWRDVIVTQSCSTGCTLLPGQCCYHDCGPDWLLNWVGHLLTSTITELGQESLPSWYWMWQWSRHKPVDQQETTESVAWDKRFQQLKSSKIFQNSKMLSARFELAIFRVSGERIDQLSHESESHYWLRYLPANSMIHVLQKRKIQSITMPVNNTHMLPLCRFLCNWLEWILEVFCRPL